MSVHLDIVISDPLNAQIETLVGSKKIEKAILISKALALYLAAVEGEKKGLKIGLALPTQKLETEFIGF